MKILIVDDTLMFRETLKSMLRPHGECTLAEDGETAVEIFRAALLAGEPFHLVLLDIIMPGMDGKETLAALRQAEREVYGAKRTRGQNACILMQTSMHGSEHMLAAFTSGCNGYVTKPVDEKKLLQKLIKLNLIPGNPDPPEAEPVTP
ncbi:MAG: response regulator [Magnetococcus sp. YQC-3]